jgi:hypothetical protein
MREVMLNKDEALETQSPIQMPIEPVDDELPAGRKRRRPRILKDIGTHHPIGAPLVNIVGNPIDVVKRKTCCAKAIPNCMQWEFIRVLRATKPFLFDSDNDFAVAHHNSCGVVPMMPWIMHSDVKQRVLSRVRRIRPTRNTQDVHRIETPPLALAAPGDENPCALRGDVLGGAPADARGSARDDCYFVLPIHLLR